MNSDRLSIIFNRLTINGIYSVLSVCKQYNMIINNDAFWNSLFSDKFDQIIIKNNYKLNYKQFYKLDNFLFKTIGKSANDVYYKQTLFLNDRKLKSIPGKIGLLTQLEDLYLHKNELKSIPIEIGKLTQLQILNLNNNPLKNNIN